MSDFKKLAEKALKKASNKNILNEAVVYPENLNERMHPDLEEQLRKDETSIGKHPAIPEGDEHSFTQKIMGERFSEVCKRYKRAFDVDKIDSKKVMSEMMPMVYETVALEAKHKKELEELAVKMIREEYDMSEDAVEIIAELTPKISLEGTKKNPKPMTVEGMEFDSHDDIVNANGEVYKRRFLNAMTQGAAKKCNHMFHMADDDLSNLDPRLPNKYAKVMSAADYMYYVIPKMENGVSGGVVKVDFPTKENPKAVIRAQAMIFPVLIHEIVKGVMELLSAHGLPKNKKVADYVINKADYLAAEPWDMRIGPAIWGRFTNAIPADDFNLKHHAYSHLASLPANEFNTQMKEIMAGTKKGNKIIEDIIHGVKRDLQEEEFNKALNEYSGGLDEDDDYHDGDIEPFL
jgi:hypothetical protein